LYGYKGSYWLFELGYDIIFDPKMATVMMIIAGVIILIYCFWQYFPFPQASAPPRCRFVGFIYYCSVGDGYPKGGLLMERE
jgi:hypothetical protein